MHSICTGRCKYTNHKHKLIFQSYRIDPYLDLQDLLPDLVLISPLTSPTILPITLTNLRAFARPFLPSFPSLPTPSLTHSYTHTIPSYPHGERTVICKLTSIGIFFVSNEKGPWQFKHCLFFLVFFFYLKIVRIIANITEPTF